jgi:hypothetical protein
MTGKRRTKTTVVVADVMAFRLGFLLLLLVNFAFVPAKESTIRLLRGTILGVTVIGTTE